MNEFKRSGLTKVCKCGQLDWAVPVCLMTLDRSILRQLRY